MTPDLERTLINAYLLIQSVPGTRGIIRRALDSMDEILDADEVSGPYDFIVRAEASNRHELSEIVDQLPRETAAILRVLPCVVLDPRNAPDRSTRDEPGEHRHE